jgi:hypothetical protein
MSEVMKCPKCGREMEKGHAHFSSMWGLKWVEGEHKRFDDLKGEILFYAQLKIELAYICKDCELVLLDYH